MAEQPIEISSSPYGPRSDQPVRRPVSQLLLGVGWLGAAALAVAASFTKVYGFVLSLPATGDNPVTPLRYSIDGWGRNRLAANPAAGFSSVGLGTGPRFGVLLCLAAVAIVLGWLIQRSSDRRLADLGLPLSGLASVFLCGVVACQLIVSWPMIAGAADDGFQLGPSLFLSAGSALLGVATWIVHLRGQQAGVPLPQDAG